jgi:hypothetical protein
MELARLAVLGTALLLAGCSSPTAPPSPPLSVELRIQDARSDTRAGQILILDAVYRNTGTTPVTVIRPQDGSFHGAVPPYMDLEVLPIHGGPGVPVLEQGCGNCGGSYDEGTMIVIPPGGETTLRTPAPWFPDAAGRYRVRMKYEVRAGDYPGRRLDIPSEDEPPRGNWPAGVFVGVVESPPLEIDCGPAR